MTEGPSQDARDAEAAGHLPSETHTQGSGKATGVLRRPGWRLARLVTLLHPPYTAWHLAYVVIGACLASTVNLTRLIATLLAFFFAVGLAAHALDELKVVP